MLCVFIGLCFMNNKYYIIEDHLSRCEYEFNVLSYNDSIICKIVILHNKYFQKLHNKLRKYLL